MLMWGYLVAFTSISVWVMLAVTRQYCWSWLWFAIPLIGGVATPVMSRKLRRKGGVKTFSDAVTSKLWSIAGLSELVLMLLCVLLRYYAGVNCWTAMLVFSLLVVPLAEIAQGLFVKENSLVAGGMVGLAVGMIALCCVVGGVALRADWFMPLFILAFIAMMIVPGHILNYKAKHQ